MQINELAQALGVSASTLRHWEKALEVDVPRDELGQRTYPPEWVAYFRQVKALLDAGQNYDQIKAELAPPQPPATEPPPPVVPPADLTELKQTVSQLQDELKQTKQQLAQAVDELGQLRESQAGTQEAVTGLQSEWKDMAAELKGCNKALSQLQKSVEGFQDVQSGVTDEIAGLQKQISALQAAPGLPAADLEALQTFRKRFWWYMVAMVFLYMVLTIGVIEGIR